MTKHHKKLFALAAIASIGLFASTAFAQDVIVNGTDEIPYAIDGRKVVTRSGFGLCWRTGYWTAAAAETAPAGEFVVGCGCDADLIPREKCEVTRVEEKPDVVEVDENKVSLEQRKFALSADVLFDFSKDVLKPEGRAALDGVVNEIRTQNVKLELFVVVGHTDRIGGDVPNQRLSERRAASVKSYLVTQGIEASYIHTEGRGRMQPVTGTSCNDIRARQVLIDCLQPDRRVDIEITGTIQN